MKKTTLEKKIKISNYLMYYIYTNIDSHINMDELSQYLNINKFYMHKIFKEIFNRNIYESIKSIRLQKASNLLLTNKFSTISEVANSCGYSSQTSFIRAFKARFAMTPKEWRRGGYKDYSNKILRQSSIATKSKAQFHSITPEIVKMPEISAYYIRHKGYNESIKQTWQKLQTWVFSNNLTNYKEIALLHDNPTITPLDECQYVACIVNEDKNITLNDRLPNFTIAKGVYAKFDLQGEFGDFLKFIHWVYHEWLPSSEYETTTKPPYVIYKKNKYLSKDNKFDISLYLSISY